MAISYLNDVEPAKKDCQLAITVDSTYAVAYDNYASMIAEALGSDDAKIERMVNCK